MASLDGAGAVQSEEMLSALVAALPTMEQAAVTLETLAAALESEAGGGEWVDVGPTR